MKAKVIETGEIIDVKCLYPVTYSRLDGNGKIIEEYDEDELEFQKEKATKSKIMDIKDAIGVVRSLVDLAKLEKYDNIIDDYEVKAMETLIDYVCKHEHLTNQLNT